jgi:hypothetical protein
MEHNLSHQPSIIERKVIWRRTAAATIAMLLLPGTQPLQAHSQQSWGHSRGTEVWRRVNVTVLARGSHVSDGGGNMDSYLVLLSDRKNSEPVAARLVDYYPAFQEAITDEAITSHRRFRVRIAYAAYCDMDSRDFTVKRVFDSDALARVQGNLPCVVVRQ